MTDQVEAIDRRRLPRWIRITLLGVSVLLLLVASGIVWFQVSVTPRIMILRAIPGSDALDGGRALAAYVPDDVVSVIDVAYGSGTDERLDVFYPDAAAEPLPTIVWVHGGGFIGGNKEGVRDYLRILASHGYTIVSIEYTKGPEAQWPTPVEQLSRAVEFIIANAADYHVDPGQLVLGGDSAGAHIAAQGALAATNPAFSEASGITFSASAEQIKGVLLFSGPYELAGIDLDDATWGFFLTTVIWAYTGYKDPSESPFEEAYSVTPWVTASFPPAFVSTGPGDPLLSQNEQLVDALRQAGADVTALFFPKETADEGIGHEFQMDLDTLEARQAMVDAVVWLRQHVSTPLELTGVSGEWNLSPSGS